MAGNRLRCHAISIHAPPRGATRKPISARGKPIFQFTPLREGRPSRRFRPSSRAPNFNSRPSARGDARGSASRLRRTNFNSRPSARGDLLFSWPFSAFRISIHAPPRGATHPRETFPASRLFQFTPLREGRQKEMLSQTNGILFQFTPLREGRLQHGGDF